MIYEYGNLTQCPMERNVYFRSTDVEQNNWTRLLWSVPDEWFWLWSQGHEIKLYDKSIKARGKIERIFVPVLKEILKYILLDIDEIERKDLSHSIKMAVLALADESSLATKFNFWRGKIKEIKLTCNTIQVPREQTWEEIGGLK